MSLDKGLTKYAKNLTDICNAVDIQRCDQIGIIKSIDYVLNN